MLSFSSSFSCFSPGLEVSEYFGWFAALSQLSLFKAEPFGRGRFLEVDCLLFQYCPSPLRGFPCVSAAMRNGQKLSHGSDWDAPASSSLTLKAGEAKLLCQSMDRLVLWTWNFCASLSDSSSISHRSDSFCVICLRDLWGKSPGCDGAAILLISSFWSSSDHRDVSRALFPAACLYQRCTVCARTFLSTAVA